MRSNGGDGAGQVDVEEGRGVGDERDLAGCKGIRDGSLARLEVSLSLDGCTLLGSFDPVLTETSSPNVLPTGFLGLDLSLSSISGRERVHRWHRRRNFSRRRVASRAVTETTGDESTPSPRVEDRREVELDRLIRPPLDLPPGVDQVLDTGCIKIGYTSKVEDDSAADGLVIIAVFAGLALLRARIVPWPVTELDIRHVFASPGVFFGVIDNSRIDIRGVGVEERFLKSVDDDTGRRGLNLDGRVGDASVATERNVNVPNLSVVGTALGSNPNTTEEVTPGSGNAEKKEDDTGGQRGVDTVLDGAEDRHEHRRSEDDPFKRGDTPETVRLSRASNQICHSVNNQSRDGGVGDVCMATIYLSAFWMNNRDWTVTYT